MSDNINIQIPTSDFTVRQLEGNGVNYAKARNLVLSWVKSGKVQATGQVVKTGKRGKPSPLYRQVVVS